MLQPFNLRLMWGLWLLVGPFATLGLGFSFHFLSKKLLRSN